MALNIRVFVLKGEPWHSNSQQVSIRCGIIEEIYDCKLPDFFFSISQLAQLESALYDGIENLVSQS